MVPDYSSEMRAFVPFEMGLTSGHLAALVNQTVYWDLVQDNEDGDRYPDIRMGNVLGSPRDRLDRDSDGVFIGQDGDHDGIPDTNRNFNAIPDYEEPFLMWDVEPNDYTYGLDRNNDEPDLREDDAQPRNSFEQRIAFLTLTNRSAYFGYNLFTILGVQHDEKSFEDPFQNLGGRDSWSLFVRGLIGFTEHGPLL